MAASYATPTDYIQHHLTFLTHPIGEGGFWTVNLDTLITTAVLGGAVNLSAGVVYAFVLAIAPGKTAGSTVMALFRAEAAKILVIIGQLWLVLANYREVVVPALLATFVITVLLFRVALFVRD